MRSFCAVIARQLQQLAASAHSLLPSQVSAWSAFNLMYNMHHRRGLTIEFSGILVPGKALSQNCDATAERLTMLKPKIQETEQAKRLAAWIADARCPKILVARALIV